MKVQNSVYEKLNECLTLLDGSGGGKKLTRKRSDINFSIGRSGTLGGPSFNFSDPTTLGIGRGGGGGGNGGGGVNGSQGGGITF